MKAKVFEVRTKDHPGDGPDSFGLVIEEKMNDWLKEKKGDLKIHHINQSVFQGSYPIIFVVVLYSD